MAATGTSTPKMEEKSQVEDLERDNVQAPLSVRSHHQGNTKLEISSFTDTSVINRTVLKTCLSSTVNT